MRFLVCVRGGLRAASNARFFLLVLLLCLSSAAAFAQEIAANTTADIVRLANGAEYKGQLAERVPDSHVVIVTLAGETKRFEWKDVVFAGPLARVPASVPPADVAVPQPAATPATQTPTGAPTAGEVQLNLQSNPQGAMWYAQAADKSQRMLCMGPCVANLLPGVYQLGLSRGSRPPIWNANSYDVKGDSTWNGIYESKRGARIAGGVILGGGILAALPMILVGTTWTSSSCASAGNSVTCADEGVSPGGKALITLGAIVGVASAVVGIVLMGRHDQVTIRPNGAVESLAVERSAPMPKGEEYEQTVWKCVGDDIKRVALTVEVDESGLIDKVSEIKDAVWTVRTCLRNNLPGSYIGGARGTRELLIQR